MTTASGFLSHPDPNESQTARALNDARLAHVPAEPQRPTRHLVAARVIPKLIAVIFGGEKIDAVSPTVDVKGPAEAAADSLPPGYWSVRAGALAAAVHAAHCSSAYGRRAGRPAQLERDVIDEIDGPRVRTGRYRDYMMMTAEPMIARAAHYTALLDTIDHQPASKLNAREREQLLEAADVLLFGEPDSERTVRWAEVLIEDLQTSKRWPVESCDELREHLHGCDAASGGS